MAARVQNIGVLLAVSPTAKFYGPMGWRGTSRHVVDHRNPSYILWVQKKKFHRSWQQVVTGSRVSTACYGRTHESSGTSQFYEPAEPIFGIGKVVAVIN
jgi:hypothetical protein